VSVVVVYNHDLIKIIVVVVVVLFLLLFLLLFMLMIIENNKRKRYVYINNALQLIILMAASTRSKTPGVCLPFSSKMADWCLQNECQEQRGYPSCTHGKISFLNMHIHIYIYIYKQGMQLHNYHCT